MKAAMNTGVVMPPRPRPRPKLRHESQERQALGLVGSQPRALLLITQPPCLLPPLKEPLHEEGPEGEQLPCVFRPRARPPPAPNLLHLLCGQFLW